MNRKRIIEIIKNWNDRQEDKLKKYILTEDITDKQRTNICSGFGRNVDSKEWIAMYDDSFTRNGKKGLLITETGIYGAMLRKPLVWDELESIWDFGILYVAILYRDGSLQEAKGATTALRKIIPVMQEVLEMIPGESVPTEKYTDFHHTYGRELRRRLIEYFKRNSEHNRELKLTETLAKEVVQNAIVSCKADVTAEQILAVWLRVGTSGKNALIFTEEAIYTSYNDGEKLLLDGLVHLTDFTDLYYYVRYENNFACKVVKMIEDKSKTEFFDVVKGIIAIYQELQKEIEQNDVQRVGLDTAAGWDFFEEKLRINEVETYKNALFVSSTFKDMHYERDIIHEKVHPALSAVAKKYGETITFCDLRWGVNTEDLDSNEGAKKVLIVCLDEIERCNPYMLIILGERYGWIPDGKIIKNALEGRGDFELEELETSVTALEIEFGAFSKQTQHERIFIYFREMKNVPSESYQSESALHAKKLAELKERVKRLAPDRVKTYTLSWDENKQNMSGIEEFAQMVTEDIQEVMESEWRSKEKLTSFETEISKHWLYAEQKAAQCYARDEVLKYYLKHLEENNHFLTLTGVSGCGKSTIMGALATILRYSNALVLPIFSSYTEKTDTGIELVRHIVWYIENLLEMKHFADEKSEAADEAWIDRMNDLTEQYSRDADIALIILIDAIDQLKADSIRDNLKFIPQNIDRMDSKVYMVISCLEDFDMAMLPMKKSVPLLEEKKKEAVISGILKRNRRELEGTVIKEIEKKAASDSPLYMTLLIQRLLMMNKNDFDDIASDGDGMAAITRHQIGIVTECGDSISAICKEMITMVAERMGDGFAKTAIEYIILSRHGLRESDLEGLLKKKGIIWNRLEFSIFINYLRNIFVFQEDNCYDFSHKIIREELAGMIEQPSERHKELANWLDGLAEDDYLRDKELVYHLIKAQDSVNFVNYVENIIRQGREIKTLRKDLVLFCREDGGRWLSEIICTCESFEFISFISKESRTMFGSEVIDLNIRETVMRAVVATMEKHHAKLSTKKTQYELSAAYSRLGKVYELKGQKKALEFFEKSLILSEALAEDKTDIERRIDLGIDYRMLANAHEIFDEDKTLKNSLLYCRKSIDLLEELIKETDDIYARKILGWSYKRMGDFYSKLKNEQVSEEYYDACRKLREQIVKEEASERNIIDLCAIYDIITERYRRKECPEKELELYEKMITYYEGIVRDNRTQDNMRKLAWAYSDAGYVYYSYEVTKNYEQALIYFEKSAAVFEESLRKKEDMFMLWSLADNYRYSVNILRNAGGVEKIIKAEQLAKRALELYEYRAQKTDENRAYDSWSLMLDIYYLTTENVNVKAECLEKNIELYELLYKRTRDKIYKKSISDMKRMRGVLKLSKLV